MGVKVREKKPGEWWVFINYHGRRQSKRIGSQKTAIDVAEKITALIKIGQFNLDKPKKSNVPLFGDYSEKWLNEYIKPLRKPGTYERYHDILNRYVKPAFEGKYIDRIKRGDIRDLLLNLHKKGLSKATIALVKDVISGPIEYGIEEEIIAVNVTRGVLKRLKLERHRQEDIEPMTPDEVSLFLDTCQKHSPEFYPFFLCAFRTGMRLGEIIGLHWGDIDWIKKFINVQRSFRRGRIDTTKTDKARRVDMSDQLNVCLQKLRTKRKKEALKEGIGDPIDIIFHRKGGYLSQNSARNVFKRILTKAGSRNMKVHNTRHTFASLLLSNGESPAYVKEQLGHSSIQMTVDIYGHLIPGSNREAVNRLDDVGAHRVQISVK